MAQAVSRRPLTMEACVRAWISVCAVCGGKSGTRTSFSSSSSILPYQYHSTVALHTHIIWGVNNKPVGGRNSETLSHSIDMNNNNIYQYIKAM
jgi:hypothetical protein